MPFSRTAEESQTLVRPISVNIQAEQVDEDIYSGEEGRNSGARGSQETGGEDGLGHGLVTEEEETRMKRKERIKKRRRIGMTMWRKEEQE